jgi:hypothetical protein
MSVVQIAPLRFRYLRLARFARLYTGGRCGQRGAQHPPPFPRCNLCLGIACEARVCLCKGSLPAENQAILPRRPFLRFMEEELIVHSLAFWLARGRGPKSATRQGTAFYPEPEKISRAVLLSG